MLGDSVCQVWLPGTDEQPRNTMNKETAINMSQYKPAAPSASLLENGLASGRYQYQEEELYKRCTRCGDYWPADTEFFFATKVTDGIDNTCRACYIERRYPNGRKGVKCTH